MYKNFFGSVTAAAVLAMAIPAVSQADSIDLDAEGFVAGSVFFTSEDGLLEYDGTDLAFDNLADVGETAVSITGPSATATDIVLSFSEPDFDVLTGDGVAFGTSTDEIEVLFDSTFIADFLGFSDGEIAGFTGTHVLATIAGTFSDLTEDDPLAFLELNGPVFDANLTLTNVNVIPLPAGGLLLLTALGGLVLVRRRATV